MYQARVLTVLLAVTLLVSACGGDEPVVRSCDEHTVYREAREHRRVQAPEGMSDLDPQREMVLPEPSPQPQRPAGSPCLDVPPSLLGPGEADGEEEAEAGEGG